MTIAEGEGVMGWLKKACGFWTMAVALVGFLSTIFAAELHKGEASFVESAVAVLSVAAVLAPVFFSGLFTYRLQRDENAWRDDPATDRQKSYADSLGIDYPRSITKGQLSDLIDRARSESR